MSASDDDLAARLAELETALDDLRGELRASGPRRRRPPTPRELLRFTEEYTIPTVIAMLEASVRSLELLQRLLRLSDPERALREEGAPTRDRMGRARTEAMEGLSRTLTDLQRALSATDLPSDPTSREVLERARDLTDEIDARIGEATSEERARRDRTRRRTRDATGTRDARGPRDAVRIDVTDETEDDGEAADDGSAVDVESELASIKDELGRDDDAAPDEPAGTGHADEPGVSSVGAGADESTGVESDGAAEDDDPTDDRPRDGAE